MQTRVGDDEFGLAVVHADLVTEQAILQGTDHLGGLEELAVLHGWHQVLCANTEHRAHNNHYRLGGNAKSFHVVP
ncbi:hypothetical protein D3C87_751040 [compost metagenome]